VQISLSDRLLTMAEAAKSLPGRPHASSIWRWYKKGARGVRLETILRGGRRFTSVEAIERFIIATTAAADGQPKPRRTPRQHERAITKAEAEIADLKNLRGG
jgi:hypothetical protein